MAQSEGWIGFDMPIENSVNGAVVEVSGAHRTRGRFWFVWVGS